MFDAHMHAHAHHTHICILTHTKKFLLHYSEGGHVQTYLPSHTLHSCILVCNSLIEAVNYKIYTVMFCSWHCTLVGLAIHNAVEKTEFLSESLQIPTLNTEIWKRRF